MFATAGSPGAIGCGEASRVRTVTIATLAHADVASRVPKAAVDVAANTHTGELRALVGALSTEEARLTHGGVSVAASAGTILEVAIGDTRSTGPDASVATATESFIRHAAALVDATSSVVVLTVRVSDARCFVVGVVAEAAVDGAGTGRDGVGAIWIGSSVHTRRSVEEVATSHADVHCLRILASCSTHGRAF